MVAPENPPESTAVEEAGRQPPPVEASGGAEPVPAVAAAATEPCFPVIGIGASAGGLEALTEFFQALPADSGLAFVVVSHLDPEHKSALGEILARLTAMPVREVEAPLSIEPDHVYVMPSNRGLTIARGVLHPVPRPDMRVPHMPVDIFLRFLAQDRKSQAVGVILSGTGSDGTLGLKAIKELGGLTFAQDESARYSGMPRSAVAAGCVDEILPPAQIAAELVRIARLPRAALFLPPAPAPAEPVEGDVFLQILRLLSNATGVDFVHYKHSTLRRRLERRLVLRRLQTLEEYLQCLRDDRAEVQTLFEEVLIPVTSFFRDPEVFEALKTTVFPQLLEKRPPGMPLRIWVPGCASGEEAYSLAICLQEYLGTQPDTPPIKIFGTDISERAIEAARSGAYSEGIAAEVSAQRLQRFFLKTDRGYQVNKTIRDQCVFARQDLTRDPPFSQLDLISCRNVLIYLGPVLQNRVLPILHYALRPGGYLVLGSSETVGTFTDLFEAADKKQRLYVRTAVPSRLTFEYTPGPGPPAAKVVLHPGAGEQGRGLADVYREADRIVLSRYAPAGVVVDENLHVVQFRGDTGRCLKPAPGPPTADLLQMTREGLLGDLQAVFLQAKKDNAPARADGVPVRTNDHFQEFNLEVLPITTPVLQSRYFVVLFEDAAARGTDFQAIPPRTRLPAPEEEPAKDREISRLKKELEAGKSYLQSVIEVKEAANEELQAANEEIVSANEELQSTNEELETAKEELQATNEELTTVNDELQNRIRVANQLGDDLANLIDTTNLPIVVLGPDLGIRRFTPSAQRVLNLGPGDVGQPMSKLKLTVNIPDLETLVHTVIDTLEVKQREITDDAGAWHKLYLRPYRTLDQKIDGVVLMLIDIDALKRREQQIERARAYASSIVETLREPLVILDRSLRVQTANRAFYQTFQMSPTETEGRLIYDLGGGQWHIPRLRTLLEEIVPQNSHFENVEVTHDLPQGGRRTMLLNARRVVQPEGLPGELILLAIEDITARKEAEGTARRLAAIVESSDDSIISQTLEGTIVSWNKGAERVYGYTAAEAVGQSLLMLAPPDRVDESRQILERIKRGEHIVHFKTCRVRKDGREIVVSKTVFPVTDEREAVIGAASISRGITDSERLVETSLRLQTQVVANMVEGVNLVRHRDGVIVYANRRCEELFGYEPGELLGKPVAIMNAPGDKSPEETANEIIRVLRQTGVWRGEIRNIRKDGTIFWTYVSVSSFTHTEHGAVWLGVQTDITERKQAENLVRDREARLRAVVETASDAVITIDEQGLIDSINPAGEKLFGYTAAEMLGQNVKMLMPSPYREEHDDYLARYLTTGEKRIIGLGREVQGRRQDGQTFPLDLAISEFQNQTRRLFTGVLRDISRRKQLQREVLDIATLEQRRIGQALHDSTGQELTALGLLAESLCESLAEQAAPLVPLAGKVREGLQRVLAQVRNYARGLIPVEVDARGLQAALAELATRTNDVLGVTCTLDCPEPVDVADNQTATHLYHIAQEAVTNALRHAKPKHISIRLESCVKFVTLHVTDDGVGISEELQRPKGMGLKIMHYRAGLINGRLTVEPADSGGTHVTCILGKGTNHGQK